MLTRSGTPACRRSVAYVCRSMCGESRIRSVAATRSHTVRMGWVVIAILTFLPGTKGYALLYLVAFFGASVSYQLITRVREEHRRSG